MVYGMHKPVSKEELSDLLFRSLEAEFVNRKQ